jgi:hypothetical protein
MKNRCRNSPQAPANRKGSGVFLFLVAAALLILCFPPAYGWENSFFGFFETSTSARAAAMGGLHSALADDAGTLFSNPAGLRSVERELKVAEVTLNFYDAAAEIAAETLFDTPGSPGDRRATYSLWGPLAFSYVRQGRGFGIFSSSNVYLHTWGASPDASVVMEDNLVIIGARAFRIPLPEKSRSTLDVGLSLVGFATLRGHYDFDPRQIIQGSATIEDMLAASGNFYRVFGGGVEFGVLYAYGKLFSIGLSGKNLALEQGRDFASIQDFLTSGTSQVWYNVLPLDLTAGLFFRPPLGGLSRIISDLVIAADYHDILDFLIYPDAATNPLLHLGLGLELKLLEIISLRAGYYQCLPSVGMGLDLTLFKLNLAYFGRELSADPGGYPVYCYTIGIEFSY